jgi:hypothetical protein
MSEEKLYTLYSWYFDGEGGYGVCEKENLPPKASYNIEIIGDFNTISELKELIIKDDPNYPMAFVKPTAEGLMEGLLSK